jgi:alanyl-tRNA synthetase
MLGAKDPLMHKLVPKLVRLMGDVYPELVRAEALITETLKGEETRFKALLERGLKLLDDEEGKLAAGAVLSGEVAFKLYDTYGFPLDLTQDVLRGHNRTVDVAGFNAAMERQKAEARKASFSSGEVATQKVWFELKEEFGPTEFLGYETLLAEGQVLALLQNGQRVNEASAGEVSVLVNQTPFYAESGGQVGDIGTITSAKAALAVTDVQKMLGLHVHQATLVQGSLKVGDYVKLSVEPKNRAAIRNNHSATHLLHAALRLTLGDHVTQKGSLVSATRLRFDISHPKAIDTAEAAKVEDLVNERIRMNSAVECRIMSQKEAMDYGAMALFGEKYGDEVRVLAMGGVDEGSNKPWSLELCGGTHVTRTGDIGLFKIVSESAVSAGVRRVEAVTGAGALVLLRDLQENVAKTSQALGAPPEAVPERLAQLLTERKAMEREIADLRRKLAMGGAGSGSVVPSNVKTLNGIKLDARVVDLPARDLRPMADELKKQIGSGVVALISTSEGKLSVVVSVTDDLKDRKSALAIIQAAGLKGGGRADMAQAGGGDVAEAEGVMKSIETSVAA